MQRKLFAFAIDPDLTVGLKLVKERDGISESEQARRAIRQWLEERDALPQKSTPTKPKPRRGRNSK